MSLPTNAEVEKARARTRESAYRWFTRTAQGRRHLGWGAMRFEPDWGVWPRWQVYFAIEDFDETVHRAEALGGVPEFACKQEALCLMRQPQKEQSEHRW